MGSITSSDVLERIVDKFYTIRRLAKVSERYLCGPKSPGACPGWPYNEKTMLATMYPFVKS